MDDNARERIKGSLRRNLGERILEGLADPKVIEIMLNPDGKVWFDYLGGSMKPVGLLPAETALQALKNIARLLGNVINEENPVLEGEFPLDGSRFEGLIPPVVSRPVFAIRKRASMVFTLDDYVSQGSLTSRQARFLREAITDSRNILVIGGTSSGKTTLLNALLAELSEVEPDSRMLIIEDTVELQCTLKNRAELRTAGQIDMTRLLKAVMRLRPNRICVGEMRGAEALALLKAWNSGHPGGFATIHADNVMDGLYKLDEYVQEANVPSKMELICRVVHYAIYIEKTPTGRMVKEIARISGYDRERKEINLSYLS